jgi:predicted TPR repeat methyltransferase
MTLAGDDQAVADLEIRLPEEEVDLAQDEEWYELTVNGETRRIRFHDYAETYATPGAYERLFYEELKCDSPRTVCGLLEEHLESEGGDPGELRVLDVGAGNGMVGEQLAELGAEEIVGVDIIEEAAKATERDRPGIYDEYYVLDLTDIPEPEHEDLRSRNLNCLTTVAALGFDDIPPKAFAEAYNVIEQGGLVSFCIKEEMVNGDDSSGFSRLIDEAVVEGAIEMKAEQRYRHRLSSNGDPLYYVAMVAEKVRDIRAAA